MRPWELIKETMFRKSHILVIHVMWCALYWLLGLLPMRNTLELGLLLFIVTGCMLPVLLSQGIIGDDITSGRSRTLFTKPMSFASIFIWRQVGLYLQCGVQLVIGAAVLWAVHATMHKGSVKNLLALSCFTWLMSCSLVTLSSAVSVLAKGGLNLLIITFGAVCAAGINFSLSQSSGYFAHAVKGFIKYGLPPVSLLWAAGQETHPGARIPMLALHSAGLVIIYGAVGIRLLCVREFPCERDY